MNTILALNKENESNHIIKTHLEDRFLLAFLIVPPPRTQMRITC